MHCSTTKRWQRRLSDEKILRNWQLGCCVVGSVRRACTPCAAIAGVVAVDPRHFRIAAVVASRSLTITSGTRLLRRLCCSLCLQAAPHICSAVQQERQHAEGCAREQTLGWNCRIAMARSASICRAPGAGKPRRARCSHCGRNGRLQAASNMVLQMLPARSVQFQLFICRGE